MKRVLLTGGAGSIGIHIISHIMENTDWEIVCLDSFKHKGYRDRLDYVLKKNPEWSSRITTIEHNLTFPIQSELQNKIGKINYLLHVAAMSDVGFSIENPMYTIKNNIDSTLVMLEYARNVDLEQFIYFSTDEVYGPVEKGGSHKEWSTHRPSNAYAASKAASEDICYSYWRSYDIPVIITNTMNNFGEMQSSSKYPVIIQKKLNEDGEVEIHGNEKEMGTRFYIHSKNSADALLHIIKQGAYHHKTGELDEPLRYHIVGDECLSNLEIAKIIANLMDKDLKYKIVNFHKDNPAHDIHYGLEDNNLRKSGWKQPMDFKESMKITIEWQQENPEWIE